jgi:trk system potassium uptake protein TrkH
LLLLSFLGLILVGTLGLMSLPGLYTGEPLSWIDALFTSTSAVCVTGLIVVDTATYFTVWGQAFLLLLIQLGGLGILTFATLALLAVGKRLSLTQEALSDGVSRVIPELDTPRMVRSIALFTFGVEGLGVALLFLLWMGRFPPGVALWHSVFHSVSAFCNAGFSTFSDSLTGFSGSGLTLTLIAILIVVGGLGFLTLEEMRVLWRRGPVRDYGDLSLHSRLVLVMTLALIIGGAGLFLVLEWGNTLAGLGPLDRAVNALFMSVTARTAGFNTVDYSHTTDASNFLSILLMSVGGSPGSTAGGIKTTTFAIVGLLALSRLRGERVVGAWGKSVPDETVNRAVGLFTLAFCAVTLGVFGISVLEIGAVSHGVAPGEFLEEMFEMVSAFNTVGLSMGRTAQLGTPAKALTVLMMFAGRIGPLTVATALARRGSNGKNGFRFSYQDVMIG